MQNGRHSSGGPTTPLAMSKTPDCDAETSIAPKPSPPQNQSIIAFTDGEDSTKGASSCDKKPQAPLNAPVTDAQWTSASSDALAKRPQLPGSAVQETSKASSGHVAQAQVLSELPSTFLGYDFDLQDAAAKIYKPIKPWQIRVVCLQPATFAAPLVCSLETANMIFYEGLSLQDTNEGILYEALSYTWQGESPTHPITVNGELYGITPNLSSALRHMRHKTSRRYIFVDALSINQYDVPERSVQVQRMLSVYQKACKVVAWLGGDETTSNLTTSRVGHSQICDVNGVDKKIYWHSWLHRTWVRQEVFAARNLYVQYGYTEIPWPDSIQGFHAARGTVGGPTVVQDSSGSEREDVKQFNSGQAGDKYEPCTSSIELRPLHHLLAAGDGFQEADPRDKVFAILGMAGIDPKRRQSALIKTDYSKSIAHVLADVTRFLIGEVGLRIILNPRSGEGTLNPLPGLPNWALDWRFNWKFPHTSDLVNWWIPGKREGNQAESLLGSIDQITTQDNYAELRLTGWSLGKIRIVGPVYDNLDKAPWPQRWEMLRERSSKTFQFASADEITGLSDGYLVVSDHIQTGHQVVALRWPIEGIALALVDETIDGQYKLVAPVFDRGSYKGDTYLPSLLIGEYLPEYLWPAENLGGETLEDKMKREEKVFVFTE